MIAESVNTSPRELHIQVSKRCNLECGMCSGHTWTADESFMEMLLFERILAECRREGVIKIAFDKGHGEPFLHPQICDMLEQAVQAGFSVMVCTNGTPLTPTQIERVAHMGLDHVRFSFGGYNKEIYERVYPGAPWEIVTRNLQYLAESLAAAKAKTTLLVQGFYAKDLLSLVRPTAYIARTKAFLFSIGIASPHHHISIQLPPDHERPALSLQSWERLLEETSDPASDVDEAKQLLSRYDQALDTVLRAAAAKMEKTPDDLNTFVERLSADIRTLGHIRLEPAYAISYRLFTQFANDNMIETVAQRPVCSIGLAPATKAVLDHLDWFQARFDKVYVGDNFKARETHFGQAVLSLDDLLAKKGEIDLFLLTTNTADIEAAYLPLLPPAQTLSMTALSQPMHQLHFSRSGLARAQRILAEIEASDNPLVVVGNKLLATAEPTFVALELQGFDVFVISLYDKMENQERSGHDESCAVARNALVSPLEQLHILTHLNKGTFWIYYDFFCNVGWDAAKSMVTYASAATMMALASRPVVMGMYDIIKPVCKNMERSHEAFALYKTMLDQADGIALTSKSDHIAEYLRNTLVKDRPVISFYRYSFPPNRPMARLSDLDGERHLVAVTSFLGEVFEPNRIETRNSIRSILRQRIHFHYYSDHSVVKDFYSTLPPEEQVYFHREAAIWDQRELVHEMSRYDGGWLVGDEATIFAQLISSVEDRHIRELYTLFVPNGVPTSSMTYGAAGLVMFISRQIKVMDEVFPTGCSIPLDMGEVDNLGNIFKRLDWQKLHQTMREQRRCFDVFHQIPRLATFLDQVKNRSFQA